MFDHVTIRVSQREASERFYDVLLPLLGISKTASDDHFAEWSDFSLSGATTERPATRRLHIGFAAPSRDDVDRFWEAGIDAGFHDDGAPGLRSLYGDDYYGAFLLDPDGNSAEAVHHATVRRGGAIDHLWIRVRDVAAASRFYQLVGAQAHFGLRHDGPDRAGFGAGNGSFSIVAGTPSAHVHVAFPAADDTTVDAFHRALGAAGYVDNGTPGERSVYHPGYYAAFVLDPDGNNVEVVNHHR